MALWALDGIMALSDSAIKSGLVLGWITFIRHCSNRNLFRLQIQEVLGEINISAPGLLSRGIYLG